VLEGGPLAVIARIDVGRLPHNISVSPDGKWIAVANRMGHSVSVIDPIELREVARVPVGRQPHDLIWSPDARVIFVGSEREGFIWRIEAGSWRPLAPLAVGVPQHTLAISASRPTELWFTVTNTAAQAHLRVYHLDQARVELIDVSDVHDVYFTPDGSEVWSSSSGFIAVPSDRIVIYDPVSKRVKEEIRLTGRYPFHAMKQNRDALFYLDQTRTMVLSDHLQESLLFVDWRERRITGEVRLGPQPFHSAYTPSRYYTTTNADDSLRVIDATSREVIHRVEIPRPHGVVLVPLDGFPSASPDPEVARFAAE
jgi:YVTN family beta-propeller protein